jgi:16S rRNA (cytosine967-C5)-methyltransferase
MEIDKYSKAWQEAWRGLQHFETQPGKLNELLEYVDPALDSTGHAQLRHHLVGVVRDWFFLETILAKLVAKRPRPGLRALLKLALHELSNCSPDRQPKVIDHAVGQARKLYSKREAGMVNAVLRAALKILPDFLPQRDRLNHPEWLIKRWEQVWSPEELTQLLHWNQQPAPVYLCCAPENAPADAKATQWKGFYRVDGLQRSSYIDVLNSGKAYIQDPMTRIPVDLADIQPGDQVLDLCAAPGGKSSRILQSLNKSGLLVAVDLPGSRSNRLRSNLQRVQSACKRQILEADILKLTNEQLEQTAGTSRFDVVLLDAPCSNTGVIRRKPDVRLRLQEKNMTDLPQLQTQLLLHAAKWLKPGGRLIYSTCSIEPEENLHVVNSLLTARPDLTLKKSDLSLPWVHGHDGGAAFLLTSQIDP